MTQPLVPQTTQQALASLNDAGLFERIASSVIRIKYPEYSELIELGTNVDGKTRKAPVDGITSILSSGSLHVTMVQHTIAAAKDLRGKWLHDPSTVKPKKRGKPTQPAGDALKAAEIAASERSRNPDTSIVLFLTTNEEPDQELTRDVANFGVDHGFDVHILSRAAIAHVLDHTSEGQSVRRRMLGVVQEMLSWDLLRELGARTVEDFPLLDDTSVRVSTQTQIDLLTRRGPLTLLSGASGSGKSVAANEWLRSACDDEGVACVVLRERTLEAARGLDAAIIAELRELYPTLDSSASPLSLLGPHQQLRLVVEDLSYADNPPQLLERILGWLVSAGEGGNKSTSFAGLHLVCPIQSRTIDSVSIERVNSFEPFKVEVAPFSPSEASEVIRLRSASHSRNITLIEAKSIAKQLGHDPLLIGLYDPDGVRDPLRVIETYVVRKLDQFAAGRSAIRFKAEMALFALTEQMLLQRKMEPALAEITEWLVPSGHDQIICGLLDFGELISVDNVGRLRFRHDRVRIWLLCDCIRKQLDTDTLARDVLAEPFYAEWIGVGSSLSQKPVANCARLVEQNPLAAFRAFAEAAESEDRVVIRNQLIDWLETERAQSRYSESLRWEAQRTLADVEAKGVAEILNKFPDHGHFADVALLRNGYLGGAIRLCAVGGMGMRYTERDELIAHVVAKHKEGFVAAMSKLIRDPNLKGLEKSAALCVAGISGCEELADAIGDRWKSETTRERVPFLADYIWAVSQCYGPLSARTVLNAALDFWAELLEDKDTRLKESRTFRMDELRLGFAVRPPVAALPHFLRRANEIDLQNQLAWTLCEVDEPSAILFIIALEAEMHERGKMVIKRIVDHWSRRHRDGVGISDVSRQALLVLWQSSNSKPYERRIGLRLWALSASSDELMVLKSLEDDPILSDSALSARMDKGDLTCVPELVKQCNSSEGSHNWWLQAHKVLCPALLKQLPSMLRLKASDLAEFDKGYAIAKAAADLVTRDASFFGERVLIESWPMLCQYGSCVQAALFVGGERLETMAEHVIAESSAPEELFRLAGMFFEGMIDGHQGATSEDQFKRLLKYREHIDDTTCQGLRHACDKLGFFSLGREFDEEDGIWTWTLENLDERFDQFALGRASDFRLEELEKAVGKRLDRKSVLDRLRLWLEGSDNPEALETAADILKSIGNVEDVQLFMSDFTERKADCEAIFSDTIFAIKRKMLRPNVTRL